MYCTNCGKHNSDLSKYCTNCGKQIHSSVNTQSHTSLEPIISQPSVAHNPLFSQAISINTFIILSILSAGLYLLIWQYRNWILIKQAEKSNINPGGRIAAAFIPIYNLFLYYEQFTKIKKIVRQEGIEANYSPGLRLISLLLLSQIYLGGLALVDIQRNINAYWHKKEPHKRIRKSATFGELLITIPGVLIFLQILYIFNLLIALIPFLLSNSISNHLPNTSNATTSVSKIDSNSTNQQRQLDSINHTKNGKLFSDKGEYEKALKDFNNAINANPTNIGAYYYRASVYSNLGNQDLAIGDYNKVLELNPNFAHAYFMRGFKFKSEKKDYDKSISDFTKSIELDLDKYNPIITDDDREYNNNRVAYLFRGQCWQEKGEYDKALKDFDIAISMSPNSVDSSGAYYGRGIAWFKKNELDKALADFNKTIELSPNSAYAYDQRGSLWKKKGDFQKALADYEIASALEPRETLFKEHIEELKKQM